MNRQAILAIDAATEACSVAWFDGTRLLSHSEVCPREHSQRMLPLVDAVLAEAESSLEQLQGLVLGIGPGGFTGVRIGMGFGMGLAAGTELPTVGINSLEAMALQAHQESGEAQVFVAIDARMGEVYAAAYRFSSPGVEPEVVMAPLVRAPALLVEEHGCLAGCWAIAGTGWATYEAILAPLVAESRLSSVLYPDAAAMATLGWQRLQRGEGQDVATLEPLYLRNNVALKKAEQQALRNG